MNQIDINNLECAITHDLADDSIASCRYGVRFILLNSSKELLSCIKLLESKGVERFNLSDIFEIHNHHSDKLLTVHRIETEITSLPGKKYVVGLSQFSRTLSNSDFVSLFESLANYETLSNDRRIYILLVNIHNRFRRLFWEYYPRRFGERIAPISVKSSVYTNRVVYYVPKMEVSDVRYFTKISCYKDWLNSELNDSDGHFVITSTLLRSIINRVNDGDGLYSYISVSSYQELIEKTHPNFFENRWFYKDLDSKEWEQLWTKADFNSTVSKYFYKYFNIQSLDVKSWLNLFFNNQDEFSKWGLLQLASTTLKINGFLKIIAESLLQEPTQIINSFVFLQKCYNFSWLSSLSLDKETYKERCLVLENCKKLNYDFSNIQLSKEDEEFIEELCVHEFERFSNLFTGLLIFENNLVLRKFKEGVLTKEQMENLVPCIKDYLNDSSLSNFGIEEWITEYFREYRNAKISDCITPIISELLHNQNSSDINFWNWFHQLSSTHNKLDSINQHGHVLWIDGLGFEWSPYLFNKLQNQLKGYDIQLFATRSEVPSNTALNKFENVTKIPVLDQLFHKAFYQFPDTLLDEFSALDHIMGTIHAACLNNDVVYIVSDHGSSALPRLIDGLNRFEATQHEGRYKCHMRELKDDEYGITYKIGDKIYYIAKTHHSLSAKPCREVHGGCTPEEVIVPLIAIKKSCRQYKVVTQFDVNIINQEVSSLSPNLELIILADKNDRIRIRCANIDKYMYGDKNKHQLIDVSGLKPGEYQISFTLGKQKVEKHFTIVNLNIEEEDLGFDD